MESVCTAQAIGELGAELKETELLIFGELTQDMASLLTYPGLDSRIWLQVSDGEYGTILRVTKGELSTIMAMVEIVEFGCDAIATTWGRIPDFKDLVMDSNRAYFNVSGPVPMATVTPSDSDSIRWPRVLICALGEIWPTFTMGILNGHIRRLADRN